MNKTTMKLMSVSALTIALAGCSNVLKDNSDDYRQETTNTLKLEVPEGSLQARDDLVIPNVNKVAALADKDAPFVAPRAIFVYYPMAKVGFKTGPDSVQFDLPAKLDKSKQMVKDYLMALHGDGETIATETDTQITSVPFQFIKQGWWDSQWSKLTNNYPERIVFSFDFSKEGEGSSITMKYKVLEKEGETPVWMTPTSRNDIYTNAIQLWGDMSRQLNKASAYLSEQGHNTPFHVWIDHRGMYAIHLNSGQSPEAAVVALFKSAGLKKLDGEENKLAVLPLANDTKASVAPHSEAGNDVAWDQSEYKYDIIHQNAGDFLVIDVSNSSSPEITSFLLMQRFVN